MAVSVTSLAGGTTQVTTDATGNSSSLRGPDGNRLPLSEAYSPASKGFPYIYKATRKTLNTATPTFTNTPTAATEVYIDFNRGSDANPGTRALPKKNLSVISSQTYGAGSVIALASDSVFDLVSTNSTDAKIVCDNIAGTVSGQALITAYDAAGHTGTKPIIMFGYKPAANEWVWDATYNAWAYSTPAGQPPEPDMCAFFGALNLQGTNAWQDPNTKGSLPPLFGDLQFGCKNNGSTIQKIYVWAPPATDPTTYYGGIRLCSNARGALHTGFNGLKYTTIDGIKFQFVASGIQVKTSGTAHAGLIVKNCEADRAGLLLYHLGAAITGQFTAFQNTGTNIPVFFIRSSGIAAATHSYDIYTNRVIGGNRQYSAQAAFYMQTNCLALGDGKVHHNYISDMWNGVGTEFNGQNGANVGYGAAYDGTAIYFDSGAHNNVAFGNVIEHCHVAMQTNSAKTAQLIGNIAIDCNVLSTSTDAASKGSNDVTVAHNTYINRLPDINQLKKGTSSDARFGISNWYEVATSSAIRVFNNALYRAAPVAGFEAIRVSNEVPTQYVAGNAVSGWTQTVKALSRNITAVGTTPDGSTIKDITATAISTTADGSAWFEGTTSAPLSTSPLRLAGVRYIDGLADMTGTAFERIPTIGALEYTPS